VSDKRKIGAVNYRRFPRLGWSVSEIGYGMWGMGGWTGADDQQSATSLDRSVELGCNFFDTAFAYGEGHSERLLGDLLRRHPNQHLFTATKVPPKNWQWPGKRSTPVDQVFPYDHIVEYTETSLANLGVETLDLQQLHVWDDSWTVDDGWKRAAETLKRSGRIQAFGISVNRWEPENVLTALETGLVDAVQVVYNIFDQAPADELFPACERLQVAVIARVPFDEGGLTGRLTAESSWPAGDFRNIYFKSPNLQQTLDRVAPLQRLVDGWSESLPDIALRWILAHPAVTTTIPGMRAMRHVEANLAASGRPLSPDAIDQLKAFRWDRRPDDRA
jgi:aryl-alcohol dehydrogenase-like predicted oxidoreductase